MISSSSSRPTNTQSSSTQVQNLNLQDTEGITVADASDVQITATDFGAVESALDLGREVVGVGMDAVLDAQREALNFGQNAFDIADRAIDVTAESTSFSLTESLDFGRDLFAGAIEAASGALSSAQEQVADTTRALGEIAKEQSTSEASRLQQVTLYALAAVAAIMIFGRARGG
jgi:hypothetical protein